MATKKPTAQAEKGPVNTDAILAALEKRFAAGDFQKKKKSDELKPLRGIIEKLAKAGASAKQIAEAINDVEAGNLTVSEAAIRQFIKDEGIATAPAAAKPAASGSPAPAPAPAKK